MRKLNPFLVLFLFISFSSIAQIHLPLTSHAERFPVSLKSQSHSVELCQLTIGHQYEVSVLADGSGCLINIQEQSTSLQVLTFVATASCKEFQLQKQCQGKLFAFVSVADLSFVLPPYSGPDDNISVSLGLTAEELVQGVLIGNNCSIDLNVQQHGNAIQFGTFANGQSSIGFESGIIISSGNISNAPGPNNTGNKGTNVPGNNSDPDLNNIATEDTYDAAVIEFDFTPITTQVQFEYVFASEEYCEFVNKDYNDVFGFFISGPGISGTKNIAQIPTTGENVSIDNVNHVKNSNFFYPNSSTCNGITNSSEIQFDGYTKPLIAKATVIPCQTYHIKLAIADVGDGIYDSAVFLKAGSFDAGDIVSVTPESNINHTQNSLEGCNNGYLLFDRSCSNDINQPLTLGITILSSSTAQEGVDYTALPTTITIPAGETRDSIPIFAIDDALAEGDETIVVEISGQYPCYKPTAVITISDKIPVQVLGKDTTLCENTSASFQPNIQSGIVPYSYLWDNGETTSTLTQNFTSSQIITCQVSDVCQTESQATFGITILPPSSGKISGDKTLCDNTSQATIQLDFTGTSPWNVTIERDNNTLFTKQYTTSTSSFDVNQNGLYRIESITSYGCSGHSEGKANITNTTLEASYTQKDISCKGLADGHITAEPKDGITPYSINWSVPSNGSLFLDGLTAKNYSFIITDGDGCTSEQSIVLTEPDALVFDTISSSHVNCYSPQGGQIQTTTTGGISPYQYVWSQGSQSADIIDLSEGTYTGITTDANGCKDSIKVEIIGNFVDPTSVVLPADTINCYHPEVILSGFGTSTGAKYEYLWTTIDGHLLIGESTLSPTIDQAGIYILTTLDTQNGCTSSNSVNTIMNITPPDVDAGLTFALNCTDTSTLIGTPNTQIENTYSWNTKNGHFLESPKKAQTIVDKAGLYKLLVFNETNGCSAHDSVYITEIAARPQSAIFSTKNPTCIGHDGSIEILRTEGGSPPYLYSFDGGDSFHDTTMNATLGSGIHKIVIQDIFGCEYHQAIDLNAPIPPSLDAIKDYTIELGDKVLLDVHSSVFTSELDSVIWIPVPDTLCTNCLTPYAQPYSTTEYHLKIVDSLHCEATVRLLVMVTDPDVYIPNAFSPEGTFRGNSNFTVYGNPIRIKIIKNLHIYDRWGNQIFMQRDFAPNLLSLGWDGEYRGKLAPEGVYIYSVEVEFIDGQTKLFKGDVTLVR